MTVLTVALASLLATPVVAQTKPDFSGDWVSVEVTIDPPEKSGGAMALPPGVTTIRQSRETLATEREAFDQKIVYTFFLDGRESRNASGAMTMVTRTRWEGARLITEGTMTSLTSQGRFVTTFTEARSLDARRRMIVETTRTESGGTPVKVRQVFARK